MMKKLGLYLLAIGVGLFLVTAVQSDSFFRQKSPDVTGSGSNLNCSDKAPEYFQQEILSIIGDEALVRKNKRKIHRYSQCLLDSLDTFTPDFDVLNFIVGVALQREITYEQKITRLQQLESELSKSVNEQQQKQLASLIAYVKFFLIGPNRGESYTNQQAIEVLEGIIAANTAVNGDVIKQSFVCDAYRVVAQHYFLGNRQDDRYFKILDEGIAKSDKDFQYGIGCHAILSLMKAHLTIMANKSQFFVFPDLMNLHIDKVSNLIDDYSRYEEFKHKKIALPRGLENQANIVRAYHIYRSSLERDKPTEYIKKVALSWQTYPAEKERYLQYWFLNDLYFDTLIRLIKIEDSQQGNARAAVLEFAEEYIQENIVSRVQQSQSLLKNKYYRFMAAYIESSFFTRNSSKYERTTTENFQKMFAILETNFNRAIQGRVEEFPLETSLLYAYRASANISYENGDQAEYFTNQCLEYAEKTGEIGDIGGKNHLMYKCAMRLFLAVCEDDIEVSDPKKYFDLIMAYKHKHRLNSYRFRFDKQLINQQCRHIKRKWS